MLYLRAMRTRPALVGLLAVAALSALAAPAIAAPTATKIALPADPSYITYPATGASGLAVTGTSNGKSDKIDLRCDGTIALVLKAGVIPNSSGVFSTTVAAATMAKLGGQSCVLRAVPTGSPSCQSVRPAYSRGSKSSGRLKSCSALDE